MKKIVTFVAVAVAMIMAGRLIVYRAAGEIRSRQAERPGMTWVRLKVNNRSARESHTVEAELKGLELQKFTLPTNGEARFRGCELSEKLIAACLDTEGRTWDINGTAWF